MGRPWNDYPFYINHGSLNNENHKLSEGRFLFCEIICSSGTTTLPAHFFRIRQALFMVKNPRVSFSRREKLKRPDVCFCPSLFLHLFWAHTLRPCSAFGKLFSSNPMLISAIFPILMSDLKSKDSFSNSIVLTL